jgi:hypothetical protein
LNITQILRNHNENTNRQDDAQQFLEGVVRSVGTEEMPGDGSYTYDDSTGRAEKFMVSGNGPTAYVVFVEFARDDVTGYLEYADSSGTTITHIPDVFVKDLRDALRVDAKARNER